MTATLTAAAAEYALRIGSQEGLPCRRGNGQHTWGRLHFLSHSSLPIVTGQLSVRACPWARSMHSPPELQKCDAKIPAPGSRDTGTVLWVGRGQGLGSASTHTVPVVWRLPIPQNKNENQWLPKITHDNTVLKSNISVLFIFSLQGFTNQDLPIKIMPKVSECNCLTLFNVVLFSSFGRIC